MKKLIVLALFLSSSVFAQSGQSYDEQFENQIKEVMKARDEMLKMLMDDSTSGAFEKRMQDIAKQFEKSGFDAFGDNEAAGVGEYDWVSTDTHKILKLKVKQVKDHPLDIKIEKGMIKIKGKVETTRGQGNQKSREQMSFENSFSLPTDVDQNSPEFENKEGEMLIKFKKLVASKEKTPSLHRNKEKERQPIGATGDELSI